MKLNYSPSHLKNYTSLKISLQRLAHTEKFLLWWQIAIMSTKLSVVGFVGLGVESLLKIKLNQRMKTT